MRYKRLPSSLFVKNRQKLAALLDNNSLAIFNSNDIMPTNADGEMGFKQNSDLFYLTGVDQEETTLLLFKDGLGQTESYIYVKETSELIKIWEGAKLTKREAEEVSGIKDVNWIAAFEDKLKEVLKSKPKVYLNSNEHARSSNAVQTRDDRFRLDFLKTYNWVSIEKIAPIMHDLRFQKETEEVEQIQKAIDITDNAFRRVLTTMKPDIYEYEIEAEIIHQFTKNGSRGHAYSPIIAGGTNACVLHYVSNDEKLQDGDLVLMDFGAEYGNYNADLTRTIPVNGRFTVRQKEVYQAVLDVMKFAISKLVIGNTFPEYNKSVGELITQKLISLGLLTQEEVDNADVKKPAYRKYFMHGTSHSLGLDVHDVDNRAKPFAEGMVFTCEPGIYIPEEGIGVRIENDILITKDGPRDLMANIPVEIDEIERLMS